MRVPDTSMKKPKPKPILKDLNADKQSTILDNTTALVGFAKDQNPVQTFRINYRDAPISEEYLVKLGEEVLEDARHNERRLDA